MNNKVTIQCEENLNIASVKLLHVDLKSAVHDVDEIILNASKVERVDAASLQLFATLFNDSEKLGVAVHWEAPSDIIVESAKILGLSNLFEIN